jgi:hypothetical protein
VQLVQEEATVPPEALMPEEKMDAFEREVERRFQQLVELIRPDFQQLSDQAHVAAVLSGDKILSQESRQRLHGLVRQIADGLENKLKHPGEPLRYAQQQQQKSMVELASNPNAFMLLERYARGIERQIERAEAQIAQW